MYYVIYYTIKTSTVDWNELMSLHISVLLQGQQGYAFGKKGTV